MDLRHVIIDYLLKRDGDKCQLCQTRLTLIDPPTIDHIVSQKAGGPDVMDNLQLLHGRCNGVKGSGIGHLNPQLIDQLIGTRQQLAIDALNDVGGVKHLAAKKLGISLRTLYRWLPSVKMSRNTV